MPVFLPRRPMHTFPPLFITHAARTLLPGRMRMLLPLLGLFLLINLLLRIGLAGWAHLLLSWQLLPALLLGTLFDLGVAAVALAPLAWLLALWPSAKAEAGNGLLWMLRLLALPACVLVAFVWFAECLFWNEFASRFNFIAVDYLIYTNEVIGNIRESYSMPLLFGSLGLVALLLWGLLAWWLRRQQQAVQHDGLRTTLRQRLRTAALWAILAAVGMWALDARLKDLFADAQMGEVAGNGYFDFWHAFNTNEIDYNRFYQTLPPSSALATLASEIAGDRPVVTVSQRPFVRQVVAQGPEIRKNVVLVSIESLSAEFLASFGNPQQLTPHLDALARDGMLFTRMYATGTRTVRGLEALTLSVPPTPGQSIVKRPHNDNLFTIGEVFKEKGYEPLFIYGGYGYFDNMNAFYSGNGYTVIDRTVLGKQDIHYENIWGVADEDLFTLTLRELNRRHAAGTPFFAHVMTTSNHRPFTYPEGRIDIASKTGREGGVKYTDWAIGQFMQQAAKQPWFRNTVFVFVADHTHKGRGRQELPPENYHIPCIIYAPGFVNPQRIDTIASQIDVAPTLLALLQFSYESRFFGQNILTEGKTHQRALLANYQTVGYYEEDRIVELKPNGKHRIVDAATGKPLAVEDAEAKHLLDEAISYYQIAAQAFRDGGLRMGAPAQ